MPPPKWWCLELPPLPPSAPPESGLEEEEEAPSAAEGRVISPAWRKREAPCLPSLLPGDMLILPALVWDCEAEEDWEEKSLEVVVVAAAAPVVSRSLPDTPPFPVAITTPPDSPAVPAAPAYVLGVCGGVASAVVSVT